MTKARDEADEDGVKDRRQPTASGGEGGEPKFLADAAYSKVCPSLTVSQEFWGGDPSSLRPAQAARMIGRVERELGSNGAAAKILLPGSIPAAGYEAAQAIEAQEQCSLQLDALNHRKSGDPFGSPPLKSSSLVRLVPDDHLLVRAAGGRRSHVAVDRAEFRAREGAGEVFLSGGL